MGEIVKSYRSTKQIRGVLYEYEDLILADGTRTSRCLGRVTKGRGDTGIPQSFVTSLVGPLEGSEGLLEGDSGLDLDDHHESPQESVSEAPTGLSVGDRVTHHLVPGLVAEITSVDTTKVKAHLLQVPPEREWLSQAQGWGWELSFAVKYLELVE